MTWVRDTDPPEVLRVTFLVSRKTHPELAQFIWSLPYRQASATLRDILSAAVKSASLASKTKPQGQETEGGKDSSLSVDKVSDEAARIIRESDRMFP